MSKFDALVRGVALMGGGFLLSVLWFDLKFDVLAWSAMVEGATVSDAHLGIIRTYYLQATGAEGSGPPLIMSMMALAIVATLLQLRHAVVSLPLKTASSLLLVPPILLAAFRIVPNARLLGEAGEAGSVLPTLEQSALAVSILQDQLYCICSIAAFLVVQLWITWRYQTVTET